MALIACKFIYFIFRIPQSTRATRKPKYLQVHIPQSTSSSALPDSAAWARGDHHGSCQGKLHPHSNRAQSRRRGDCRHQRC
jgi:hypothetical protein